MTSRPAFQPVRGLAVDMDHDGKVIRVGRLALVDREILFEFDKDFPEALNISPFTLRPEPGSTVIPAIPRLFEGLHGVFNDSLPDGWGRLLVDRKLREVGIRPGELSPLDRLAWVGKRGMGALRYEPAHPALGESRDAAIDLDAMASAALLVLEDRPDVVIDELLRVGGSPGGARPKALVGRAPDGSSLVHGEEDLPQGYGHWLVKFGAREDPPEAGVIELAYADMARAAGVIMPETARFPSRKGPGYFGAKRFDREGGGRIHSHTICGLLNADHRLPGISYEDMLKATMILTRKREELNQMFTRMVFNVLARNRDDHTKNHSFLMDGNGEWSASPAYDVTFSPGPGGEHSLDIAGEGRNPSEAHLLAVADRVGVSRGIAARSIEMVRAAVGDWPRFAGMHDVPRKAMLEVGRALGV